MVDDGINKTRHLKKFKIFFTLKMLLNEFKIEEF